ncbi:ribbon-helix-helix domain-containing protein [Trichocoleus sp. Lan]|uniref:CopG family ribbon-helix-helix protein n=1 Tax=Trichocoleus sp. Lan TaxID=2933927 RepID=UPI003297F28C
MEKTTVGVRLPNNYLKEIDAIANKLNRTRSQVLFEAVELYLGKTLSSKIDNELEHLKIRLEAVEKKLNSLIVPASRSKGK